MGLLSVLGTIGGNILLPGVGGVIGGALGGAIEGSDTARAAEQAAGTTAAATDRAAALQKQMFDKQVQLAEPWRQSGIAAQNRLLTLLGVNPNVAAAGGGGGGGGGFFGIAGAIANQIASSGALGTPSGLTVNTASPEFGKYGKAFSETNWQQDPGYAFRLSEGQKALERSAARRGGLISGAALKAATRYGQDMGSQEYQNAFNRYYNERNQMLNPLQSLAGVGQTTAQQLGSAGQQYGQNVGNALIDQGYAAGTAGLAAAQARQSMYGGMGQALGQVPTSQWSSLGSALRNYLTPSIGYGFGYAGEGPEGYAP